MGRVRSVGGWNGEGTTLQEDQHENTVQPDEDAVKIEPDELLQAENPSRVRKWLRRTFKWCVDALSFRCLRVAASSRQQVNANFYGPCRQSGSSSSSYSAVSDDLPLYHARVQDFPLLGEAVRATPSFASGGTSTDTLGSFTGTSVADANDDDDSDMRIARQTAAEIEWYNEAAEPRAALPTRPKPGAWSEEEHERYCQGLEKYRYGPWKLIANYVGTRTIGQVRSHAQSVRAKRKRAEKREKGGFAHSNTRQTGANKSARATTATPGVLSRLPSTRSRKMTPEELLLASMAKSTTSTEPSNNVLAADGQPAQDDVDTSPDIPLCSPPLDIQLGSFLRDEDLFEILDTPL